MKYAITLLPDPRGGYTVTFPDVPEAITEGDTLEEALRHASEALEAALSFYLDANREIPKPVAKGAHMVGPPALSQAKLFLYRTMRQAGVTKAELARRLGWSKTQVGRLLDLNHDSRLDQVEAALAVLGKRLDVRVIAA
jgi:antitoxin HicB